MGALFTAALALLLRPLAPVGPDAWSLGGLSEYAHQQSPENLLMAAVWLGATVLCSYALVVSLLAFSALLMKSTSSISLIDRFTVPFLRELIGASLVATIAAGPTGTAFAGGAHATSPAVMVVDQPVSAPTPDPAVMTLEGTPILDAPLSATVAESVPGASPVHQVRPGDHFWSIAEEHLAKVTERRPTEREIGKYWQRLVAANRDRLRVPGNPDLIFPGQEMVLPQP
jgi:hypothetical protein